MADNVFPIHPRSAMDNEEDGDEAPAAPPGTQVLAAILLIMQGLAQIARITIGAGVILLAAIGAMYLLGR